MPYKVIIQEQAQQDMARLALSEPKALAKVQSFMLELREHPRTGTGHPEQLKGKLSEQWSRRITKKHRLIYEIHDMEVIVIVISAYGHYSVK